MGRLIRDGVALWYEDAGRGAPPLIFIHDLKRDHTVWAPQFEHFRHSHRVVAVDLRGHGRSDAQPQGYTLAALADELAWMAYELGLYRPVLVGHAFGGMVAIECAAHCPQLPAAIVTVDLPYPATGETGCKATTPRESIAPPDWVAQPIQGSVRSWDADAALAQVKLPLLCVTTGTPQVDPGHLHSVCPQATVEQLSDVGRINAAIERFLLFPARQDHLTLE